MVVATPTKTEQRRRRALDGLTLRDLISNWEFHNQTEGKSPHTVAWYNDTLGAFERFLERNQRSLLLADIGEPEVRDFIADMREHRWPNGFEKEARPGGLTPESIQTRVRKRKSRLVSAPTGQTCSVMSVYSWSSSRPGASVISLRLPRSRMSRTGSPTSSSQTRMQRVHMMQRSAS